MKADPKTYRFYTTPFSGKEAPIPDVLHPNTEGFGNHAKLIA